MNRESIEEILQRIGSEDIPADMHAIVEETSEQFSKILFMPRKQISWSYFRESRITKLAAAVLLLVLVTIGAIVFMFLGEGSHSSRPQELTVSYEDGAAHDIDFFIGDEVHVKDSATNNPTTVNLVSSGEIRLNLNAYDHSSFNMSDGSLGVSLYAYDSSQVNVSGGSIGDGVFAHDNSRVNIFGGSIGGDLGVYDSSHVTLLGGTIGGDLDIRDNGVLIIDGSDFNYSLGKIHDSNGILTGILASGEPINNDFKIHSGASVILVPEPCTIALLALGGLVVIRRKRY